MFIGKQFQIMYLYILKKIYFVIHIHKIQSKNIILEKV